MEDNKTHLDTALDLFDQTVTLALKHYTDKEWLGQNSILATPYFLGDVLHEVDAPDSDEGRGTALQRMLTRAADMIWPGPLPQSRQGLLNEVERERNEIGRNWPRFQFLLLELRYLRRYFSPRTPPTTVSAMQDFLMVSKNRFHVHLRASCAKLSNNLLKITQPGLRLEIPYLKTEIVGRDELIQKCLMHLEKRQSVTVTGEGGIGKTTLGTAITQQWPTDMIFWHTFRPGLNDDLGSVVFAISHFLNKRGSSGLWLQLIANGGQFGNVEQILGFLREDLDKSINIPFLFCFDEIDLLHTATSQPRHGVHKQILELLEGLRIDIPILLMGQRALIDTDAHIALQSLTLKDTEGLFKRKLSAFEIDNAAFIHRLAGGNPRLIELYIALIDDGDDISDWSYRRPPSLKPLFHRLWKRLSEDEKQSLSRLSVYRGFAPIEAVENKVGLRRLRERSLIDEDKATGIALRSYFRQFIYDEIPELKRKDNHNSAGVVRATRGEITKAAFHFWQAEQYEHAINLWFSVRDIEIQNGNAGAAYALFTTQPNRKLPEDIAKRLKVIRDMLHLFYGDAAKVLEDIDSYSWHPEEEISGEAFEGLANARLLSRDTFGALEKLNDAIEVFNKVALRIVLLHRRRGQIFIGQAEPHSAELEVQLAQYEIERLKGHIATARGDYQSALEYLKLALELAQQNEDSERIAKANQLIAITFGNRGDLEEAKAHARIASAYYEQIGDRIQLEGLRAELAGSYLNVGKFQEVIEPAEQALAFFEKIGHKLWVEYLCSNLAEAHLECNNIEKAESLALRVVNSENPRLQPYANYTLALVRNKQGRLQDSEHLFKHGLSLAENAEDKQIAAYLYRAYGEVVATTRNREEGIQLIHQALGIFREQQLDREIRNTLRLLDQYESI